MKKQLQKFIPKAIGAKINLTAIVNPRRAAQAAFAIFCTPRDGKVREEQKEYLTDAQHTILTSGETNIQSYRWRGNGKKILLIHGWESNTYRWHLLITELKKKNYDIYAIDAPGHGKSSGHILNVPLYAKAIEVATNAFKPEIIIGHSIGGLATVFHQYKYKPQHYKKVVILGSASELDEIMQDYKRILGLKHSVMKALEALTLENFGFDFKGFSGAAFAKSLTTPALIIHDKFDKITPVSASRGIHANWAGSTYIETEGFGHSLYQEEVRSEILKFIED